MISKAARVLMLWLAACATPLLLANATAAAEFAGARLEQSSLPARGKNQTLLTVDAFGRYAVTVSSAQGVGLQALDRMAGAGPVYGEAGKRDGRLDLFLDRGETRIITHGAAQASGEAKLTAHAFQELSARPPLLVEQRWEQASLDDFQQRSYWLDIREERTVALEAAGRHLADLRLWRDGIWLIDSAPVIERNDARPDRPLTVARLTVKLTPGLYLLTAYGGPGQPWTEASTAKPFYLRWGLPSLPPALRQRFVMNELGVERFRVPVEPDSGGPTYFRLELPSARDASLQVGGYAPEAPLQNNGPNATISKKSTPPVAELTWDGSGDRLITVRSAPGQPYMLQHFEARQDFRFSQAGAYWLSTIQAGHAEDAAGASAVLTRIPERGRESYLADRAIEFGPKTAWHRRFNLLDELTLFVKLPAHGKIGVLGQGVKARYRFEPFLTSRPANYQPPPWRDSGYAFELDAGLYVLTVQPVNKGILDLQLQAVEATEKESDWLEAAKSLLGLETKPSAPAAIGAITPVTATARFPELALERRSTYRLYMNKQPGVATGIVLRALPIDLGQALPVSQRPGERLTIPVSVPEAGILRALSEDGQALEISLADGRKGSALSVAPGRHQVSVQAGTTALNYVLAVEPTRLASSTPLPPLPDTRLAELPAFPVILPDTPQFLALGRQSGATFNVHVDRPGLYRFESGGLLQTAGKVRTRINPGLFEASANGVGRNFLIQRYLHEGEYQLGVSTEGETRGDLEVRLVRTDLIDGGELRPGETGRAMLQTGQALAYGLRVGKRASYRLQAMGLGRNFAMRLEDEGGWPLDLSSASANAAIETQATAEPGTDEQSSTESASEETSEAETEESAEPTETAESEAAPRVEPAQSGAGVVESGDVTLELKPGLYRVLVLPQSVDAHVLTRFEQVPEARRFEGHGPHRLVLGTPVQHTWQEPEKGKLRISDHWRFTLPAAAEVSISLDAGMEANLLNAADRSRRLAHLPAGQAWKGSLPAGGYLLRVRHSRGDNLVDYRLTVASKELLAGQTRDLMAPASVPLSVGKNGLVVLQSFGNTDVRARLLDAEGRVIAQNDDPSDDWNFHIAQRLAPGSYTLMVEPAGAQSEASKARRRMNPAKVATIVGMRMPREIEEPALAPGSEIDIKDAHVHVYPITVPAAANLLLASARSGIAAGLALEGEGERGWLNLGSTVGRTPYLLLPLAAERFKAYRLRAWATEPRGLPLRLRIAAADLAPTDEERWLRGDAPAVAVDEGRADLRVAAVKLARPGSFRIWSDSGAWQWTDSPARAAEGGGSGAIAVNGALLWLLSETGASAPAGERLRLSVSKGDPLHLLLADGQTGQVDLPPAGPTLTLVLADARGGQPGLAFGNDHEVAGMGLAPGQAVAVALPGIVPTPAAPVTVWNAGSAAPIEVDLHRVALQSSPAQTLAMGVHDASLKAGEALPLGLPPGTKRVGLALAVKTAAVLVRADRILATHWSASEDLRESIATDADRLWLLNTGDEEVRYNVEVAPEASLQPPLRPGGLVVHNLAAAGRLRLPVELPAEGVEGLRLHVRGDVQAYWQEAGGRVLAGNDFSPRAGGALWLWHKPGPLVAWLDGPAGDAPPDLGLAPTVVAPPQSVPLQGEAQLLAIRSDQPAMLHLRSETQMVSQFLLPGQAPRTEAHLHGASLNLAAPAGAAKLLLRALGAAGLTGSATLLATPATPIGEGMGPEALLPPGGARLYSFELRQAAAIGIGVRASSDVAHCMLYDAQGAPLGEGVVQMPELKPGRYLLAVEIPADSPPVRVRPVLLGTQAPDTRPPYDILRRYMEAGEDAAGLIYVPRAAAPEPAQAAAEADEPAPAGDAGTPPAEE